MSYEVNDGDIVDFGLYRGRRLRMALPDRSDLIHQYMVDNKCLWQQVQLERTLRYVPVKAHVVDIGAYTGSSTVWFAQCAAARKVVSIEPDAGCFDVLCTNVRLNGLSKSVTAVQSAVWDSDGYASLAFSHVANHGATQYRPCPARTPGAVKMVKLDTLLADREYKVDVVFMCMEGYEANALRGARSVLLKDRPVVIMTAQWPHDTGIDPSYDNMQGYFQRLGVLSEYGYRAEMVDWCTTVFLPKDVKEGND